MVMALCLIAPGAALVAGGVVAIDGRHYEFRFRVVRGIGPVGLGERGVAVFNGAEAVR
jgi:hypothetical protein